MEKTMSGKRLLIIIGTAGMVASLLSASQLSAGWVPFWLGSAFALGFGLGMGGGHVH